MESREKSKLTESQPRGGISQPDAQPPDKIVARPNYLRWDALIDEASEGSFPASDPPSSTHCSCT